MSAFRSLAITLQSTVWGAAPAAAFAWPNRRRHSHSKSIVPSSTADSSSLLLFNYSPRFRLIRASLLIPLDPVTLVDLNSLPVS